MRQAAVRDEVRRSLISKAIHSLRKLIFSILYQTKGEHSVSGSNSLGGGACGLRSFAGPRISSCLCLIISPFISV